MDRKLLDLLVCPETRQPLALLGASGLAALNAAVAAGALSRVDGTPQSAPYQWWRWHDEYGEDQNQGRCH